MFKRLEMGKVIFALRIAIGLVFLWFGALKLFGYNPVFDIIYASFTFLARGIGFFLLGLFETVIGVGLLFNLWPVVVHLALVGHLLGTLTVFVTGYEIMFAPYFPILTLAGEFVFKNIVLLLAGFAVAVYNEQHKK